MNENTKNIIISSDKYIFLNDNESRDKIKFLEQSFCELMQITKELINNNDELIDENIKIKDQLEKIILETKKQKHNKFVLPLKYKKIEFYIKNNN